MGADKALISLRDGDPPLIAIARDRVGRVAADVVIVARGRSHYGRFGVPVVEDRFSSAGPLTGIATALLTVHNDYCLVVACDLPFLNVDFLQWMAAQPRDYDALVPRIPGESRQGGTFVYQTLHAIYAKRCLPAIERRLRAGNHQVVGLLDDVNVKAVEVDVIQRFDPELRTFFNVNTPEAAQQARRWLEEAANRGRTAR